MVPGTVSPATKAWISCCLVQSDASEAVDGVPPLLGNTPNTSAMLASDPPQPDTEFTPGFVAFSPPMMLK